MGTEFAVVGWFTTAMGCDRDNSEDSEDIMEGYERLYVPAEEWVHADIGAKKEWSIFWGFTHQQYRISRLIEGE